MPTRDEIEFIKWAETMSPGHNAMVMTNCPMPLIIGKFSDLGLCAGCAGVLTPRAADLIATAKHVGLDELVADDEPSGGDLHCKPGERARLDCPDCQGRGRVRYGAGLQRFVDVKITMEIPWGGR